jgi:hypothetical protein
VIEDDGNEFSFHLFFVHLLLYDGSGLHIPIFS